MLKFSFRYDFKRIFFFVVEGSFLKCFASSSFFFVQLLPKLAALHLLRRPWKAGICTNIATAAYGNGKCETLKGLLISERWELFSRIIAI
jgi:hypothetical protein